MSEATCQHPPDLTALVIDADIPTAVGTEKHRKCCQVFMRQMIIYITLVRCLKCV